MMSPRQSQRAALAFLGFTVACGSLNSGQVIVDGTSAGGSAGAAGEDGSNSATDMGGATSDGWHDLDNSSSAGGAGGGDAGGNDDSAATSESDSETATHGGPSGGGSDSGGTGGNSGGNTSSGNTSSGGTSSGGTSSGGNTSTGGGAATTTETTTTSTTGSGCAEACSGGQTCEAGTCECPEDEPEWCGEECTDVLTDPDHCGRCDHSCHGGTCSDGRCDAITLASGRTAPWELAVNDDGAYWLEQNAVRGVSLDGGTVVTIADEDSVSAPSAIAASPTTVYYKNQGGDMSIVNYQYALMEVAATGGGNPQAFWKYGVNGASSYGLTYSNGRIYWCSPTTETVYAADEGSAGEEPDEIFFGYNTIYPPGYDLAVDDSFVYWGEYNSWILKHPLSDGALEGDVIELNELGSSSGQVYQLVLGGGYVYWTTGTPTTPQATTPANSTVKKVPIDGGEVGPVAAGLAVTPAVAADAIGVYWSDGNIKRTPHDGGPTETLVEGENAGFIALDDDFVYWTDATSGKVMKVAK